MTNQGKNVPRGELSPTSLGRGHQRWTAGSMRWEDAMIAPDMQYDDVICNGGEGGGGYFFLKSDTYSS